MVCMFGAGSDSEVKVPVVYVCVQVVFCES